MLTSFSIYFNEYDVNVPDKPEKYTITYLKKLGNLLVLRTAVPVNILKYINSVLRCVCLIDSLILSMTILVVAASLFH